MYIHIFLSSCHYPKLSLPLSTFYNNSSLGSQPCGTELRSIPNAELPWEVSPTTIVRLSWNIHLVTQEACQFPTDKERSQDRRVRRELSRLWTTSVRSLRAYMHVTFANHFYVPLLRGNGEIYSIIFNSKCP